MRVLITGGRGQLACDLTKALRNHDVVALGRDSLDITDTQQIDGALERYCPAVVINTAAIHAVDRCEDEPEASFAVNAAAPRRLAAACARHDAVLVQVSTDYVFDGVKSAPYTEDDPVCPLSVYGVSKAAGEMAVRCTTDRHIIVRACGLYGPSNRSGGKNFVETMLRLGRTRKELRVVADQVLTPSYTYDVAAVTVQLLEGGATGTFHVTNSGQCSWFEFTRAIFTYADMDVTVTPVSQDEWGAPARRPSFSVLASEGLRKLNIPSPRSWEMALQEYLRSRDMGGGP